MCGKANPIISKKNWEMVNKKYREISVMGTSKKLKKYKPLEEFIIYSFRNIIEKTCKTKMNCGMKKKKMNI